METVVADRSERASSADQWLFDGPGEMRALCRAFDWSSTSLGPVASWSQSLCTTVDQCLSSVVPGFLFWGPELVQIYNDAACESVGAKHPKTLGMPVREAWGEVWDTVGPLFEQAWAGEGVRVDDLPLVPDRGGPLQTAWFTFSFGPVRDQKGSVAGVSCVLLETTARVHAELALRESEARLRRMVNIDGVGVLTFDATGTVIDANDAFLQMMGYSRAHVDTRSLTWRSMTPPEYVTKSEAEMERLARTGRIGPYEKEYVCADGSRTWLLFAGAALGDGTIVEYCIDVSDRHRAEDALRHSEEALRSSEARVRALVENVQDYAIFLLDARGFVTEWTPGAERVKKYSSDEVLGRHVSMFYTPEGIAAGEPDREIAEAASSGRAERESWRVRKGGERFWVNEIMTAVRDADGHLTGFTKISRDLTDRLLAQEVTDRGRASAERDELRRQLAGAEEAERRRLARELHDQLGQQLTAFSLGLEDATRLAAEVDSNGARDGVALQLRLEELQGLARTMTLGARYLALELRPPELDDMGLFHALETYVREWSTRYSVSAEVAVGGLAADRAIPVDLASTLYRIAQEALTNVAKHARASHVSVVLDQVDGEVRLIVEDDGRGFDVTTVRARARHERRLGLAGIEERATLAGGTTTIESTSGGGTALYVRLPASRSQELASTGTP